MPVPQQRRPTVPFTVLMAARNVLQHGLSYNQGISELSRMRRNGDFGTWAGALEDVRSALSWVLQARNAGDKLTANIFEGHKYKPTLPFNPHQEREYQLVVGANVHYGRGVRIKTVYITLNSNSLPSAREIETAIQTAIDHGTEVYRERRPTLIDGYHIREAYSGV